MHARDTTNNLRHFPTIYRSKPFLTRVSCSRDMPQNNPVIPHLYNPPTPITIPQTLPRSPPSLEKHAPPHPSRTPPLSRLHLHPPQPPLAAVSLQNLCISRLFLELTWGHMGQRRLKIA